MNSENTRGFSIDSIKPNTRMIVETKNSFYEFSFGQEVTVFGGTLIDGSTRFKKPTPVKINGCTYGGSAIRVNWIGEDMRLEFCVPDCRVVVTTTPIYNVILESFDGEWRYSLDWHIKKIENTK